ncbi:hydroxylysine kinase-like [Ciona intestinalis]
MALPHDKIACALKEQFGFEVESIKAFGGYEDFNYYIREVLSQRELLLKVKRPLHDPESPTSDVMRKAMVHLRSHGVPAPEPIKQRDGKYYGCYKFDDPVGMRFLELYTFVPGKTVVDTLWTPTSMERMAANVGQFCAKVTLALQTFMCELDIPNGIFNPQNFLFFQKYERFVKDEVTAGIIKECFRMFDENFPIAKKNLRKGFIHCDLSTANIILGEDERLWVIDFELICRSYIVFELSICVAYIMITAVQYNGDPILMAQIAIRSYEKLLPLNTTERNFLSIAICARLATSYLSANYQATIQPQNVEYLFAQAGKCPQLLHVLHKRRINRKKGEQSII